MGTPVALGPGTTVWPSAFSIGFSGFFGGGQQSEAEKNLKNLNRKNLPLGRVTGFLVFQALVFDGTLIDSYFAEGENA